MPSPDGTNNSVCMVQLLERRGQGCQSCCRRLLHEEIPAMPVLECIQNQINRIVQCHHETRHIRISNRNLVTGLDLLNPKRNHRAPTGHHIPIAGTADCCFGLFSQLTRLGHGNLLHHRLGNSHRVDRVTGFVRTQYNHILNIVFDSGIQHIRRTDNISLHSLHREEFTTGNLFQSGSMENIIHATHHNIDRTFITNVADIKFHLGILQLMPHIILLLFVATENPNLLDLRIQKTPQYGIPERSSSAGNQQHFVFKHKNLFFDYKLSCHKIQ